MQPAVLIIDDEQSFGDFLVDGFRRQGVPAVHKTSGEAALQALSTQQFDVVFADLHLQGMDGLELCRRILAQSPDVPVIVITGFGSMESAISAIRSGAYDFVSKPVDLTHIVAMARRAAQDRVLRREVRRLRKLLPENAGFAGIIGQSGPMKQVQDLIERVAGTEATTLITGESGTGKELVARALHDLGRRRNGPFVAVNCGAMPESLLESELFGHAKGAFTDAHASRTGLFVTANKGTMFLDEIGEMPMGVQVKLLRALQERSVRPVGANAEVPFDTRIVAATNRDLEALVAQGRFRQDLFFRINVVRVDVPPLRARGSDVLLLAQHFLERCAAANNKPVTGFSPAAAERLVAYSWPGNVRELHNSIERAVAVARFDHLVVDDLPDRARNAGDAPKVIEEADDPADMMTMDEIERRYIVRVLGAVGGNKTKAAEVLGFDRKTLYRKIERYALEDEVAQPREQRRVAAA